MIMLARARSTRLPPPPLLLLSLLSFVLMMMMMVAFVSVAVSAAPVGFESAHPAAVPVQSENETDSGNEMLLSLGQLGILQVFTILSTYHDCSPPTLFLDSLTNVKEKGLCSPPFEIKGCNDPK